MMGVDFLARQRLLCVFSEYVPLLVCSHGGGKANMMGL